MFYFLSAHWITGADPGDFWFTAGIAILLAVSGFIGIFVFLRRLRFVEDTPKSLIRSAAQGYVELNGRCQLMPGEPIIAPLTERPCVWWSYSIEQKKSAGNNRVTWSTIQHRTSDDLFFIEDGTGHCAVDPDHAVVYPSIKQIWYGDTEMPEGGPAIGRLGVTSSYRYSESRIESDDTLYALGYFHTQGPAGMGEINEEIRQLLVEWKHDQAALLRRFDTDHDGQIDQTEWDAAREEARKEVLAEERAAMSRPPMNILSRPRDGRPFLLSTEPQTRLETRLRMYIAICLFGFFIAGAVSARMLTLRFESVPPAHYSSASQTP
ncbi:MAG: GIDE domain-containing protein [Gammaproteobacteria bacterium]